MMNLLLFLLGLVALPGGASLLVRGASKLALSGGAVFDGKTDLAIGNVVGSNNFNVLFILGVSALTTTGS